MNLFHTFFLLLFWQQLPARSTLPVVTVSPPHLGVPFSAGGYFVKLLNESGKISLPWPPPPPLVSGLPWFVDVQNLGPEDVILEDGRDIEIHLRPKDAIRIVSNTQRYSVKR